MNGGQADRLVIRFDRGSLVVSGWPRQQMNLPHYLIWDPRVQAHRCLAIHYRALVRRLIGEGRPYRDEARQYPELSLPAGDLAALYPFQREALAAWERGKRGIVELPTGAGKTRLALQALCSVNRGSLIVVPTLDLLAQWCAVLQEGLGVSAGVVGGGSFDPRPVTVCTYASAYRRGETFGDRFCLVIFDECHHLSGGGYRRIPEVMIAPYRLGLSATVAWADARRHALHPIIGPIVYKRSITELRGRYLANYRIETIRAELSPAERKAYREARRCYLEYARKRGLTPTSAGMWQRFIFAASGNPEGRRALDAYYRQRQIAYAPQAKFAVLKELLHRHRAERVLIFTNDNSTAYQISRDLLLPIITHQTPMGERRRALENFRNDRWPFLVTSRVLNEGVDLPRANVAVILSGSASVREHVQRLGRILRKAPGKEAVLYEVISRTPAEERVSRRRRQHDAYR